MSKILVVDDEESVLTLIGEIISQDSHEFEFAHTGVEGIEKFRSDNFDLVITDLVMPEKSGLDLIMELRKLDPHVKIIAISGGGGITGRFDYLPIAKLVGAMKVVQKPFQVGEFRETISDLLGSAEKI